MPNITYHPCDSSQIHSFGYDQASQTLGVKFPVRGKDIAEDTPPTVYHYFGVPPDVFASFQAAESKGSFFGKNIRGVFAYAKQTDANGIVFGLTLDQCPKYTVSQKDGRIVNRATGKPIPDDEPVFILRASDANALEAMYRYHEVCANMSHEESVLNRIEAFDGFSERHPERMKEPDSAPLPTTAAAV